ncbi:MAG: hypothetical protein JWQ11_203, partial [Rhizobacter sp.]|nr:hypothetical protein [Rhizobacter sp.]
TAAVTAFHQLLSKPPAANSHPAIPRHSLPLHDDGAAATLLFQAMSTACTPEGQVSNAATLSELEPFVPHMEAIIKALEDARSITSTDAKLLREAAPRIATAVALTREFAGSNSLHYQFIARTLSLSTESRMESAMPSAETLTRVVRPLTHWVRHLSHDQFVKYGHRASQARLIDRALQVKLISPAQHRVLSTCSEDTIHEFREWDGEANALISMPPMPKIKR